MRKNIIWAILSLIILFGLPLLTSKFAGSNGMALCFIMFFAINPVFFIFEGIASGKNIKSHWFLPIVSALIYLVSMWLIFDMGEIAFVIYSGIYLSIGIVTMIITMLVQR